eukprot:3749425-Amphidinium_carterae.2
MNGATNIALGLPTASLCGSAHSVPSNGYLAQPERLRLQDLKMSDLRKATHRQETCSTMVISNKINSARSVGDATNLSVTSVRSGPRSGAFYEIAQDICSHENGNCMSSLWAHKGNE